MRNYWRIRPSYANLIKIIDICTILIKKPPLVSDGQMKVNKTMKNKTSQYYTIFFNYANVLLFRLILNYAYMVHIRNLLFMFVVKKDMKKIIVILAVIMASCTKDDCYIIDKGGNKMPFVGNIRTNYGEYISSGKTVINGNTYLKSNNDLTKICD